MGTGRGSLITNRVMMIAAILMMARIIAAGAVFYRIQEKSLRRSMEAQLESIAEVKVSQITQWREEQLLQASAITEESLFKVDVRRFLKEGRPEKFPGSSLP
jgi:hypothetical protein